MNFFKRKRRERALAILDFTLRLYESGAQIELPADFWEMALRVGMFVERAEVRRDGFVPKRTGNECAKCAKQ